MERKALTDNSGKWFDVSKAEIFEEDCVWNGSNNISCATDRAHRRRGCNLVNQE